VFSGYRRISTPDKVRLREIGHIVNEDLTLESGRLKEMPEYDTGGGRRPVSYGRVSPHPAMSHSRAW